MEPYLQKIVVDGRHGGGQMPQTLEHFSVARFAEAEDPRNDILHRLPLRCLCGQPKKILKWDFVRADLTNHTGEGTLLLSYYGSGGHCDRVTKFS